VDPFELQNQPAVEEQLIKTGGSDFSFTVCRL